MVKNMDHPAEYVLIILVVLLNSAHENDGSDPLGHVWDNERYDLYEATEVERHYNLALKHISLRMNSRIRPNIGNGALTVSLGLLITSLGSISERSMDFKLTFHMEQVWTDPRLQYNNTHFKTLKIPTELVQKLWRPDLYFINDVKTEAYQVPSPNVICRIRHDGYISYITRMTSRLSCPMDLQRYPLDTQICPLMIESYSYDTSEMVLEMLPRGVEMDPAIRLPCYHHKGVHIENCSREYSAGTFPCVRISVSLKRQIGFYLLQLYLPSALMVALSWLSFWINANASVERMALGVTLLLTLTTMFYGAKSALPEVSYLTALDLWMTVCLVFMVAATLEFAIVHVRGRHKEIYMHNDDHIECNEESNSVINNPHEPFRSPTKNQALRKTKAPLAMPHLCGFTLNEDQDHVDYASRILFPLMFAVFNAIYWPHFISNYRN